MKIAQLFIHMLLRGTMQMYRTHIQPRIMQGGINKGGCTCSLRYYVIILIARMSGSGDPAACTQTQTQAVIVLLLQSLPEEEGHAP